VSSWVRSVCTQRCDTWPREVGACYSTPGSENGPPCFNRWTLDQAGIGSRFVGRIHRQGDNAMVMGDIVLLDRELNPVMAKLRSAGFEITAVHNHLMEEIPKVLYLHYMGHGAAAQLATALRAALSVSKTPLEKPTAAA
jgi:hypothetical protein